MSDYWVSKKKYFCKYCDIYIADDAPSRQHHESGMRHKGNLERYIRGIYKTGEKRKKDLEEEKREMAQIERAANAAFAQDIGAGLAKASAPVASSSSAARKPPPNPSNPYANYTTAAQLGYTDPDAERLAAEQEMRRSQGIAGEWQTVSNGIPTPSLGTSQSPEQEGEDEKPDVTASASVGEKRPADAPADEDVYGFKVRKKRLNVGLGEVYDPGLIPIKLKKKEEPKEEPVSQPEPSQSTPLPPLDVPPKWAPLQLKPRAGESSSSVPVKTESSASSNSQETAPPQPAPSASKWTKSSWATATDEVKTEPDSFPFIKAEGPSPDPITDEWAAVKGEAAESSIPPPDAPSEPPAPVFKKRKAPTSTARGRRGM